ncbi:MAG: hypothetical protein CMP10_07405 [Zetaproteobacteria bacterium]|nr:hypothetical protein [Pseudobdellovibrionaceae bacterium]
MQKKNLLDLVIDKYIANRRLAIGVFILSSLGSFFAFSTMHSKPTNLYYSTIRLSSDSNFMLYLLHKSLSTTQYKAIKSAKYIDINIIGPKQTNYDTEILEIKKITSNIWYLKDFTPSMLNTSTFKILQNSIETIFETKLEYSISLKKTLIDGINRAMIDNKYSEATLYKAKYILDAISRLQEDRMLQTNKFEYQLTSSEVRKWAGDSEQQRKQNILLYICILTPILISSFLVLLAERLKNFGNKNTSK